MNEWYGFRCNELVCSDRWANAAISTLCLYLHREHRQKSHMESLNIQVDVAASSSHCAVVQHPGLAPEAISSDGEIMLVIFNDCRSDLKWPDTFIGALSSKIMGQSDHYKIYTKHNETDLALFPIKISRILLFATLLLFASRYLSIKAIYQIMKTIEAFLCQTFLAQNVVKWWSVMSNSFTAVPENSTTIEFTPVTQFTTVKDSPKELQQRRK